MTTRDKAIKIRVTEEEKRKFTEYADEHHYKSRSAFLRIVAHNFIATDDEDGVDTDDLREIINDATSDTVAKLNQLDERLTSLESQLQNDDETDKLARDIYATLPVHESPDDLPNMFHDVRDDADASNSLDAARKQSTPEAWAQWFNEDVADVRRACARMLEYYPDVEYYHREFDERVSETFSAPSRRYYKTSDT